MRIKGILESAEQKKAYADFMLQFEVYSLRMVCLIGAFHIGLFLIIDYWRADHYSYVLLFRLLMIGLVGLSAYYSSSLKHRSQYEIVCVLIVVSVFGLACAMDRVAGLPSFFLANFICLLFYVFNAGLGYSMSLKLVLTFAYVVTFTVYALAFSPHAEFHVGQSFNIAVNATISLIIGFLIERYKQLNFVQRTESIKARNKVEELDVLKSKLIQTLAERNEQLRAIFDSTKVSVIGTDVNGIINHFNKGAEQLLGYSADEVIGKVTPAIIHTEEEVSQRGDDLTKEFGREIRGFDVFVEFAKQGKYESREWTYVRKDGTQFPVQLVVTALRNQQNEVFGFLGIATDISQLKTQSEIIKQQKEHLEILNATKDKFFTIVAHDLKSPLTSLKSFSTMLVDHYDRLGKNEIIAMSQQLKASVDNTIKMADNLITWARIQMNDIQFHQETFRVYDVASSVLEVYKDVASSKGLTMNFAVDDKLLVVGDKSQIEFVIRNLVNNSIKFTHSGGVVSIAVKSLSNGEIELMVSDTGIGISDEMKGKLFTLGKKRSTNGTAAEKGTGLGLILTHEFVKQNGGQIEFESEPGKGTTFYVRFKSDQI